MRRTYGGDLESVQVLMGYRADNDIRDSLDRRPLDMHISSTNDQGNGSLSRDHAGTSEEWEEASVTSSQLGSVDKAN